FSTYLFLLELSHTWGPALDVPGATPAELIGFPFHWSFWMDAGGSPAGGDGLGGNGGGAFTVDGVEAHKGPHSMLYLYINGLAQPTEVMSFGVLENPMPPANVTDPLWGGAYAAHSFPWFDASTSLTVPATRKAFTIDDVVSQNGMRDPPAGMSP